jgi:hypothetical protein
MLLTQQTFTCSLTQLEGFAKTSRAGERITYYRGHLVEDRDPDCTKDDEFSAEVAAIGKLARSLYERGIARLIQRRVGEGIYEYLVERTSQPEELPKVVSPKRPRGQPRRPKGAECYLVPDGAA